MWKPLEDVVSVQGLSMAQDDGIWKNDILERDKSMAHESECAPGTH